MAQRVGLADAIKQRELDDEDREGSSDGAQADDWVTGPDSPVKKSVSLKSNAPVYQKQNCG